LQRSNKAKKIVEKVTSNEKWGKIRGDLDLIDQINHKYNRPILFYFFLIAVICKTIFIVVISELQ